MLFLGAEPHQQCPPQLDEQHVNALGLWDDAVAFAKVIEAMQCGPHQVRALEAVAGYHGAHFDRGVPQGHASSQHRRQELIDATRLIIGQHRRRR
jgi:hypothetical protein